MNIRKEDFFDAAVIGGGPAGLTAALYLARARRRVIVLEKDRYGGQIALTHEIVNYPGVKTAGGAEFAETLRRQAESFGAEFRLCRAERLEKHPDGVFEVTTDRGPVFAHGVLLATGAVPRQAGFAGEEEFRGRGVGYCATCDGEFFAGKDVFVIGGGFAAAEESVYLSRFARKVTVLVRGKSFSCAASVAEETLRNPKIDVRFGVTAESVSGDEGGIRSIRCRNSETGEGFEFRAAEGENFGVFVFAGSVPESSLVRGLAETTDAGFAVTDRNQQTSLEGLFAAGDVCEKALRQAVTAAGDGAAAAIALERHAAEREKLTGLKAALPDRETKETVSSVPEKPAGASGGSELFSPEVKKQLAAVFSRMESSLTLQLTLDSRPVSRELEAYAEALSRESEKIRVTRDGTDGHAPSVRVLREDGSWSGLAFHGVPGGHEFTSFVLGLYNAAGPGQAVSDGVRQRAESISKPVRLQVLVSLSCTMCPDLVTAAQRLASLNGNVTAEVYDIAHYPDLRERFRVMSVPCLVTDGENVSFGRKNLETLLQTLGV